MTFNKRASRARCERDLVALREIHDVIIRESSVALTYFRTDPISREVAHHWSVSAHRLMKLAIQIVEGKWELLSDLMIEDVMHLGRHELKGTAGDFFGVARSILLIDEVRETFLFRVGDHDPSPYQVKRWLRYVKNIRTAPMDLNDLNVIGRTKPDVE